MGASARVAQPSSAASSGTVPVPVLSAAQIITGGETPPELAAEDACATFGCRSIVLPQRCLVRLDEFHHFRMGDHYFGIALQGGVVMAGEPVSGF